MLSQSSTKKQNQLCVCVCVRGTGSHDCGGLARATSGGGGCRLGAQERVAIQTKRQLMEIQGESMFRMKTGVCLLGNSLLLRGGQPFVLFGPSTDWMRPPMLWRTMCFTLSTHANVNLVQRRPHGNSENMTDPNVWAPGPDQVDTQNEESQKAPAFAKTF